MRLRLANCLLEDRAFDGELLRNVDVIAEGDYRAAVATPGAF